MAEATANEKLGNTSLIDATVNIDSGSKNHSPPIRGAIKTIITTSTDNLVAGEFFSILVTIQNPFETELKINGVSTSFPIEFKDLKSSRLDGTSVHANDQQPETTSSSLLARFADLLNRVKLNIGLGPLDVELSPSFAMALENGLQKSEQCMSYTPLQPGNSTVRTFTIKTRKNILFTPASYRFNILIDYQLNNKRNLDTIQHTVNVRASLFSILVGAAVGGVGGWLINKRDTLFLDNSLLGNLISLLVSVLISLLAVVLLARKKDIQPLITVEDIWGGIAIGFIAAYSGPKYLVSLVQPPGNTTV